MPLRSCQAADGRDNSYTVEISQISHRNIAALNREVAVRGDMGQKSARFLPELSRNSCSFCQETWQIPVNYRSTVSFSSKKPYFRRTVCHCRLCFHIHSRIDLHF